MQRVCRVEGGVKRYLKEPDCLVSKETRKCPFCADGHGLQLHGWYRRWALLPDPEQPQRIPVRRLYCRRVGQTVSLLPDFCIPHRQHGPAILALFLKIFLAGTGLLEALRRVRREAPCHAVAQSLRDGFLKRAVKIRAYLAQRQRRAIEPPQQILKDRRRLAELFFGLVAGFKSPQAAFIFHEWASDLWKENWRIFPMPSYDPQQIALFRYQVIAPLVSLSGPRGTLRGEMERIAARSHEHPYRGPTQYRLATIEEWHYLYKREGLDGLLPAARRDRGHSRVIDDQTAERIESLAQSRPDLDGRGILAELRCGLQDHNQKAPSLSSLYRFLRARGLDQRCGPRRQDHRAYAFDLAGDCWQGDVMYGPRLTTPQGTRRKTYLIALLDDATRLVPHGQFYFEQHLRSLKDCLKQALLKRGVPRRLYLDNGKIFRSRLLLGLCARLGIELIHSRPYRPQGRAKIERFFGTLRRGFLARLDVDRIEDLDALNRLLFAWVEGKYHVTPHRGIEGETPLDRWLRLSEGLRPLGREVDLDELFWDQTTRRVAKDGTFSLKGRIFEAGPVLIGWQVTVRFDPFDLRRVLISTPDDRTQQAFPVDLEGNRRVRRNPPPEPQERPPVALKALHDLADRMDERQNPDQDKENRDE